MKDLYKSNNTVAEVEAIRPSSRGHIDGNAELFVLQHSLAERRKMLGISQAELARRVGTSRSALARIELGTTDCRISTLQRITVALGGKVNLSFQQVNIDKQKLASFCRKHRIIKLSLFGSILRSDFGSDSDIDVLVEFAPNHVPGLAFFGIEQELSGILGRKVDLNTPKFLSRYFRDEVLKQAQVQYDAA